MEIYELKYFLAVAQFENIRHASTKIRISSASLSKAIHRLEHNLGVKLFEKDGRNIRLTSHGLALQKHAVDIINLEESARNQISKSSSHLKCIVTGPEILLTQYCIKLTKAIESKYKSCEFEMNSTSEQMAISSLQHGDAHLGLIVGEAPAEFLCKTIDSTDFHIYAGLEHPLLSTGKENKAVALEKVLEHPFATPNHFFLGQMDRRQSVDGWRDDKWPRKVKYATSCLKILESFIIDGQALAYLPDYYAKNLPVKKIMTNNSRTTFSQEIKIIVNPKTQKHWVTELFQSKSKLNFS